MWPMSGGSPGHAAMASVGTIPLNARGERTYPVISEILGSPLVDITDKEPHSKGE